jgi:hypothetical protein
MKTTDKRSQKIEAPSLLCASCCQEGQIAGSSLREREHKVSRGPIEVLYCVLAAFDKD